MSIFMLNTVYVILLVHIKQQKLGIFKAMVVVPFLLALTATVVEFTLVTQKLLSNDSILANHYLTFSLTAVHIDIIHGTFALCGMETIVILRELSRCLILIAVASWMVLVITAAAVQTSMNVFLIDVPNKLDVFSSELFLDCLVVYR